MTCPASMAARGSRTTAPMDIDVVWRVKVSSWCLTSFTNTK